MYASAYTIGLKFIGIEEVKGSIDNPHIMTMLTLDTYWPQNDEVPWCSAFVNYIAWLLDLQRSKSLRARSWLKVGFKVDTLDHAQMTNDVVIIKRGPDPQPGPEVIDAPGHVGIYAGRQLGKVRLLGGNQGNAVSIQSYPQNDIIGIRRLSA